MEYAINSSPDERTPRVQTIVSGWFDRLIVSHGCDNILVLARPQMQFGVARSQHAASFVYGDDTAMQDEKTQG
ncbi:MAG: hypothetical protein J0I47_06350 [Sphingomonas sp.]|uniref:hypothetical protein n=1 Tax=Sphingomonas sp. TaxID=28214 RepID=UPI001AD28513|nr:hypothetical protein [Sphingomonas sp.]MBN8807841.1 hypothetical protein [Sphingomonas sp.]